MFQKTPKSQKFKNSKSYLRRPQIKKGQKNKLWLEMKNIKNDIFEN